MALALQDLLNKWNLNEFEENCNKYIKLKEEIEAGMSSVAEVDQRAQRLMTIKDTIDSYERKLIEARTSVNVMLVDEGGDLQYDIRQELREKKEKLKGG